MVSLSWIYLFHLCIHLLTRIISIDLCVFVWVDQKFSAKRSSKNHRHIQRQCSTKNFSVMFFVVIFLLICFFWVISLTILEAGLPRLLKSLQISSDLKFLLRSPLISSKNVDFQENLLKFKKQKITFWQSHC